MRESSHASAPDLSQYDQRNPIYDEKYQNIPTAALPKTESMDDTVNRIMPFWYNTIARNVFNNKKVLIVAHKNTLRAIFKHL